MKHLSVKCCQILSNEGPGSLPMGDNNWGENKIGNVDVSKRFRTK